MNKKPIIYIASPYTKGDPAINARFQCEIFDELLTRGKVTPIAPLWAHFQHLIFPRHYQDWIDYDNSLLHLYDGCLRLGAHNTAANYLEFESSGADAEAKAFTDAGKPVFFSLTTLYHWVNNEWGQE